jgi:DNA-directed RNA polymerase specialized sigma24 family protein
MIIALAEYAAIGEEQIAAMLDLDRSAVATLLSQGRATIEQAAGV